MKKIAIISGLLSGLLFGIATPLSKLLLTDLNYFRLAGLLYIGAGIAMIPFVMKKDNNLIKLFTQRNILKTSGIILFGGLLGPLLLLIGLQTAEAASVSIWLNMELVATAILGVLIFQDHLDKFTWLGVILTVLAGVIISIGEGISCVISGLIDTGACICWGLDNHLTAITDGASPQTVTFVKGIVAGLVNLLIGVVISDNSFVLNNIFFALIVGAFSYGISISLYVTSAQNIGAPRSQILFSTAPLWGVILAYILFRGSFRWVHLLAILLLAAAIAAINLLSQNHIHTHQTLEHFHYHKHNHNGKNIPIRISK
ncbi:MAG: DMT family transporter [Candidatus Marinimicrobia bacterium]|nr:DMT family transporter [Candidatus Neomarinimicrobiota bacterium]